MTRLTDLSPMAARCLYTARELPHRPHLLTRLLFEVAEFHEAVAVAYADWMTRDGTHDAGSERCKGAPAHDRALDDPEEGYPYLEREQGA